MDTKSLHDLVNSLPPAVRTATASGVAVDLANVASVTIEVLVGAVTDGVHAPIVTECDTQAGPFVAVAGVDLIGGLVPLVSNVNQRVGYRGRKRWLKATLSVGGSPAVGAAACVLVMRSGARRGGA